MAARSAEDAVVAAREALHAAEADFAFWMRQYKRNFQDVCEWVDAARAREDDQAPRYRLLQQLLQDSRHGLDCATRAVFEARTELSSARQFYLKIIGTEHAMETDDMAFEADSSPPRSPESRTAASVGHTSFLEGERGPRDLASFTIRARLTRPDSEVTRAATAPASTAMAVETENGEVWEHGEASAAAPEPRVVQPTGTSFARAEPTAAAPVGNCPESNTTAVYTSPLKRRRTSEPLFLVPCYRNKYPKIFEWEDKTMHHFPQDVTIPICKLSTMWVLWLCGDSASKTPPFRIMVPQDLDKSIRRSLSALRYVMMEIEARIVAEDAWVNDPSTENALEMLELVKESLSIRPSTSRTLHPVVGLKWTSMIRILRDQLRMQESKGNHNNRGD